MLNMGAGYENFAYLASFAINSEQYGVIISLVCSPYLQGSDFEVDGLGCSDSVRAYG
jgi:hypothetical protein